MIESAHDDLVARPQRRADRARDVERERRHIRPERDLVRIDAEQVGERGMGVLDDRVRALGGEERAAMVGVRLAVVACDRVDHRLGDLRPAGTVEEDDRPSVLGEREGREPGANRVDIEGLHLAGDASRSGGRRFAAR
jgi:hypothetical protein